ncbi:MAG: IS21 family transposase, partial [Steroidobacteraceae bacterium]
AWRAEHHRGRRPAIWTPGEHLVFDWGEIGPLYVFCAVLAWSRFRFVAFAAGLVVPTPAYVAFANHYGFRPDFCEGADPESKGIVENLVGYAKSDLMVPGELTVADLVGANEAGRAWCVEVNAAVHSEMVGITERSPDSITEIPQALSRMVSLRRV